MRGQNSQKINVEQNERGTGKGSGSTGGSIYIKIRIYHSCGSGFGLNRIQLTPPDRESEFRSKEIN